MDENNTRQDETKKDGKISGFLKKVGKKLDDATYSMRLQGSFDSSHAKYGIYSGTGVFDASPEIAAEEHPDEGYIITLSNNEQIKEGNLIKTPKGEVLYIAATVKTTLNVEFEGKINEMPAIKIVLGNKAQEVKVIKVDDKFYLA